MKHFVFCAAMMVTMSATAQNYKILPVGDSVNSSGERTYFVPSTTLYVKLTVQHESIRSGMYARYAQKYFGTAAVVSDRDTYTIIDAQVSDKAFDKTIIMPSIAPLPTATVNIMEHTATLSQDAAAQETAMFIYSLRKRRVDLIYGDIGEHIYGEGLKAALDEMTRLEQEYLTLFYGSQTSDIQTYTYAVTPVTEQTAYVLCRFNARLGVLAFNDPTGSPIMLTLVATGIPDNLYPTPDLKNKKEAVLPFQIADNSSVSVDFDGTKLVGATIPIFQMGRTVMIAK